MTVQGVRCGLLCEVVTVGLGFWAYELFQSLYRDSHGGDAPSPRARGLLGGCSALVVLTCSMPVETVLRRLQAGLTPSFLLPGPCPPTPLQWWRGPAGF